MTIGVAIIASRCEGLIDFSVEAKRENIVGGREGKERERRNRDRALGGGELRK